MLEFICETIVSAPEPSYLVAPSKESQRSLTLFSTVPQISSHEINIYIRTFGVFIPEGLRGQRLGCQSKASSWDLGKKKKAINSPTAEKQ